MRNWTLNSLSESGCCKDKKPLDGILVVDFSQFLSGPSAGLRLADLGARVVKIERPETGDICRTLYVSNLVLDGDSSIFHAINRNKESFAANLKKQSDFQVIKELIQKADVVIQNFRPGVMNKLGFDYETVKEYNPGIVYGEITGYGTEGPWKDAPGQDLLVQSRSGLTLLGGGTIPKPMGLAIVDMAAGVHLAQGILASLVRKSIFGQGALVQVSLLESILDFQSERLSSFLTSGTLEKNRPMQYGICETADGYIALAEGAMDELAEKNTHVLPPEFAAHIKGNSTKECLSLLEEIGLESSEVLTWDQLFQHEGFKALDMIQEIKRSNGHAMKTTRCPIRIDGEIYKAEKGSPKIGEHTTRILEEMLLGKEGDSL